MTQLGARETNVSDATTETPANDAWGRLIDELWHANPMSKLLPLSPAEVSKSLQRVWLAALENPTRGMSAYTDLVAQSAQLWTNATLQLMGISTPEAKPVA
jgi:hypothetical protein